MAGIDPRRCKLDSALNLTKTIDDQANRLAIFNQIGTIGNVDALKDFGLSSVGKGAKFLSNMSDVIGSGSSAFMPGSGQIPGMSVSGFLSSSLESGAAAVAGIVDPAGSILGALDPVALNLATNDLKNTFERVKAGNFSLSEAPNLLQNVINAEKALTSQANKILGIFDDNKSPRPIMPDCSMSIPYALDLADKLAPKQKNFFIVEFIFHPDIRNSSPQVSEIAANAAYFIKTTTRPGYSIEYEDVNMYNTRTKVPKTLTYDPMTFTLYDDGKDHVVRLYQTMTRILNPMAGNGYEFIGNVEYNQFEPLFDDSALYDGRGGSAAGASEFEHGLGAVPRAFRTNSIAAFPIGTSLIKPAPPNLFSRISLYHIYERGYKYDAHHFLNPTISTVKLSDLDMADSEVCDMTIEFTYSGVRTENGIDFNRGETQIGTTKPESTSQPKRNIQEVGNVLGAKPIGGQFLTIKDVAAPSIVNDAPASDPSVLATATQAFTNKASEFATAASKTITNAAAALGNGVTNAFNAVNPFS